MAYIGNSTIAGDTGINRTITYFHATSNQTIFTVPGGYVTQEIDVFKNGVKLQRVIDYSDTSGTNIVLTTPATENDLIEVVSYVNIYSLFNIYTKSQSDAKYVNTQKLFAVNLIFGT